MEEISFSVYQRIGEIPSLIELLTQFLGERVTPEMLTHLDCCILEWLDKIKSIYGKETLVDLRKEDGEWRVVLLIPLIIMQ